MINKPVGTLLEGFDVVRLDGGKERRGVFAREVPYTGGPDLTANQIAGHHEEKPALYQLTSDEKLGRMQRGGRMKASRTAYVARVNKQVVERDEALQIKRVGMHCGQDSDSANACLQWAIEGHRSLAVRRYGFVHCNRSSLASW